MTFTKNRYSYALALSRGVDRRGRRGGCGAECSESMFFSRTWNKEINEFNDSSLAIETLAWESKTHMQMAPGCLDGD